MTTQEYIKQHRNDDVYRLALAKTPEGVDLQYALQQISAYQILTKKVPSWAECDELIFPRQLSLEQSSSELTARYKAELIKEFMGNQPFTHIDLTGGMGIDCYFIAQNASASHYVEQNGDLCQIAQHNFAHLNPNITVHNTTAEEFLNQSTDNRVQSTDKSIAEDSKNAKSQLSTLNSKLSTLIYLDPARRGDHGQKLVSIADCQPNVIELLPQMFAFTDKVVVKLSPMLDITRAINELEHIEHLYVISVANECKELLLLINREYEGETEIHAVNLKSTIDFSDKERQSVNFIAKGSKTFDSQFSNFNSQLNDFSGTLSHEAGLSLSYACEVGEYLYEPYAAHLKSGLYKTIAEQFGVEKLHQHSHLYTSEKENSEFPGRMFRVKEVMPFNKKMMKALCKEYPKANLTTRNFPLTVSQLRTQYKIKEGGDTYLFATTLYDDSLVIVVCEKCDK